MKKSTMGLVILLLHTLTVWADEDGGVFLGKPFGLGVGPSYIGGRDTDTKGTEVSLKIYEQFINYKRLTKQSLVEDEKYYSRWFAEDECIGSCPYKSICKKGICMCNPAEDVVQIYGRCFSNSRANILGDKDKYRKPTPPPRPEWCFCMKRNDEKEVCREHRDREECMLIAYPNSFDHSNQFCKRGDHRFCLGKDINMFCGSRTQYDPRDRIHKHVCECRKDMKFDHSKMECRLFIDVDCTNETAAGYDKESNLAKVLRGVAEPEKEFTTGEIINTFCNVLEESVEKPKEVSFIFDQLLTYIGNFFFP